jgi:trigger factor
VKAVRRKELPDLNDEFAKDLGDFKTLEELRETIRKSIQQEREHRAQEEAKSQLIDKLVDSHEFPVPDAYIDRQIQINVENQLRSLAAQGVDPKQIKLDWAKVRETQKDRAVRDVKASLILDKIGEREAIGPTQEEIDREVQRIARQQREAAAVTRAKLQKEGGIARIAGHIRTDKTLSFLFEHARKEAAKQETQDTQDNA